MLTIVCVVLEFSVLRSWKVLEFCSVISVATLRAMQACETDENGMNIKISAD